MATISPTPKLQFLDANGNPLSYGLLYTYSSGTTIPLATYTSQAQTTANTNPIVLDARGEASVFLLAGFSYRFVLQNSSGVTQYTTDPFNALGEMAFQNASSVAITGGTITGVTLNGPITGNITGNVNGDVTGNLTGNVTGGTVVAASYNGGQLAGLRNKVINGSMVVNQRGPSALTTSTGTATFFNSTKMLDRWTYWAATPAVFSVTQSTDAPASEPNLYYSQRLTVTTADAVIANNNGFSMAHIIEGYAARTLVGKTFTVSFWVRSSVIGTYCLSLYNGNWPSTDESYVATYAVLAPNTWEYKTITVIDGLPTTGTYWDWTSGSGLTLAWSLGTGSNFHTGSPGVWTSDWGLATIDQVNAVDTIGNIFALTGVQVEVGTVATPFEHRPFHMELALCQRYYEKSFPYATAPAQNVASTLGAPAATGQVLNQTFSTSVRFAVTKRRAPTMTLYSPNAASANWETVAGVTPTAATANIGDSGFIATGSTAVTAGGLYSIHWLANAEL
jgi:hypothetical protein